jgi:arylsulfatase A-like enzyme
MRVLYLDLDSLRYDHLGCYGYPRPTTPNLDRLAREGVRFRNVFAADTPCVPARASIFTGQRGIRTGLVTHGPRAQQVGRFGPPAPRGRSQQELVAAFSEDGLGWPPRGSSVPLVHQYLGSRLRSAGLRTAAVSTFGEQATWFTRGWQTLLRPRPDVATQQVLAEDVSDAAVAWLREHAREDFFLYVHYWDPHIPYHAPRRYVDQMLTHPPPEWPTDEQVKREVAEVGDYPCTARATHIWGKPELDYWLAMYDAEIAYCDEHVGRVLGALAAAGVLDDTLVLATTDHGENQGEHRLYGNHCGVYETDSRLWMLARWPHGGLEPGAAVDAACYTMDIGPTLCEVAGLEPPPAWQGRSFLGLLRGGAEPEPGREYVVLEHGLWSAQRAVRTVSAPDGRDWKLVKSYHGGLLDWPLTALYDLANDPREERDVSAAHPDALRELEHTLWRWEEEELGGRPDPLRIVAAEGPELVNDILRRLKTGAPRWWHPPRPEGMTVPPLEQVARTQTFRPEARA